MASHRRRCVFVLIDGLGDAALPCLNNRTPLEHASTPWIDALARGGLNGLMDPVEPGLACGSDTAHLSILGYDPRRYYRGRGSFEAMGAGVQMQEGDVAFKCNFCTLEEDGGGGGGGGGKRKRTTNAGRIVKRRRVDREFPTWGTPLCDALNGLPVPGYPQLQVTVMYATEHRCAVNLRLSRDHADGAAPPNAPTLTDQITGTDPLKDNLPLQQPRALVTGGDNSGDSSSASTDAAAAVASASSQFSASALAAVSDEFIRVLSDHPINVERRAGGKPPANAVLLRGPGERIRAPPFATRHGGCRAFMIAPTAIIAGIGVSLNMDVFKPAGTTGDYHTDLGVKARVALSKLAPADAGAEQPYDFGFVHVKATDDAGHDKDVARKVEWIERSDQMVGQILQGLADVGGGGFAVVVTGDHSTPVLSGDHSYEPVPFLICDSEAAVLKAAADNTGACGAARAGADGDGCAAAAADGAAAAEHDALLSNRIVHGRADNVQKFSEVCAARGALGRFPGSEAMSIIKQFCHWNAEPAAGAPPRQ